MNNRHVYSTIVERDTGLQYTHGEEQYHYLFVQTKLNQ